MPIVCVNMLQWSISHPHATKSKKHNKKDLVDGCRDMVTIGGTCRDPWSIHTMTNIVDFSFYVLLFTFSIFMSFTFYFLHFHFLLFTCFTFYLLHGYRWSLQHVAAVRHESGIIVSALINFSITFYFPINFLLFTFYMDIVGPCSMWQV